jgi:hypothetical protein
MTEGPGLSLIKSSLQIGENQPSDLVLLKTGLSVT